MKLKSRIGDRVYAFKDLKDLFAKANEKKSGDELLGMVAENDSERLAAKYVLSELSLDEIRKNPLIEDEVTLVIDSTINERIHDEIKTMSVGCLREYILDHKTTREDIIRVSRGLNGEMIAAVTKIMGAMDLVYAASKIKISATCSTELGLPKTLSFRIQPNHPADDIDGILASTYEGLSYGSGDALIGVNPVDDTVESTSAILNATWDLIQRLGVPTQNCVLSHITTQMKAVNSGASSCMLFQSIAGTEKANKAFGVSESLLDEGFDLIKKLGVAPGPNLMYFETGQGSEMSLDCHEGIDLMTLEARTYGYARKYKPFIVNNVSGFIGPETLYDGKQMIRANLEDHFMGKLTGLPMGMAPCYTNHTNIEHEDQEMATMLLAMAGSNYYIGIPVADDIMLAYQDTSYHDNATLRELLDLKPALEFFRWAINMGILDENAVLTDKAGDASMFHKI